MVFGIYGDRMVRIIKRSLYGVTLRKNWFKILILENDCATGKITNLKLENHWNQNLWETRLSLTDQRMEMYLTDIVNKYTKYFALRFLDIVYCLHWSRSYEALVGKSWKKLGFVLYLLFYYSHRKRLLLQSM